MYGLQLYMMKTRHQYVVPCEVHSHDCKVIYEVEFKLKSNTKIKRVLNIVQALADVVVDNDKWRLFVYRRCTPNTYTVSRCIRLDSINDNMTMRTLSLVGNDKAFKLVLKHWKQ